MKPSWDWLLAWLVSHRLTSGILVYCGCQSVCRKMHTLWWKYSPRLVHSAPKHSKLHSENLYTPHPHTSLLTGLPCMCTNPFMLAGWSTANYYRLTLPGSMSPLCILIWECNYWEPLQLSAVKSRVFFFQSISSENWHPLIWLQWLCLLINLH